VTAHGGEACALRPVQSGRRLVPQPVRDASQDLDPSGDEGCIDVFVMDLGSLRTAATTPGHRGGRALQRQTAWRCKAIRRSSTRCPPERGLTATLARVLTTAAPT
jgi:hypothetical protein